MNIWGKNWDPDAPTCKEERLAVIAISGGNPHICRRLFLLRPNVTYPMTCQYLIKRGIVGKHFLDFWDECGGTPGQVISRLRHLQMRDMITPYRVQDLVRINERH